MPMNIQHATFNIERLIKPRRGVGRWALNVECWMFFLLCLGTPALFAQTNSEPADAGATLLPSYDEVPPGFLEAHGAAVVPSVLVVCVLVTLIIWRGLRPKPPARLPPEVEARTALEILRQRSEDGACLSHICQILRRYFIAAFQLPPGEWTTAEFSRVISSNAQIGAELAAKVSGFLDRCDEQKFSLTKPGGASRAVDQALALIGQAEARRTPIAGPDSVRA